MKKKATENPKGFFNKDFVEISSNCIHLIFFVCTSFSVAPGFEAMKDQNICNKIMVKFIQNYSNIFETDPESFTEEQGTVLIVKVS